MDTRLRRCYYFSRAFRNVMGISPSQYRSIRLGKATYKE
ncbi:AraC family transcriptional regulator [Nitrincola nitratireducens]